MNSVYGRGLTLLFGTALFSFAVIFSGHALLKQGKGKVNPNISEDNLWKLYRWSIDPHQRREAAILLSVKSKGSAFRQRRLLAGLGWGSSPLAGVALKLQGETYKQLGQKDEARQIPSTQLEPVQLQHLIS